MVGGLLCALLLCLSVVIIRDGALLNPILCRSPNQKVFPLIGPTKGLIGKLSIFYLFFLGYVFFLYKTWSGLNFGILGPNNSDSSSKTTQIVLFPGLNSSIQIKIPQHLFFSVKVFVNLFLIHLFSCFCLENVFLIFSSFF